MLLFLSLVMIWNILAFLGLAVLFQSTLKETIYYFIKILILHFPKPRYLSLKAKYLPLKILLEAVQSLIIHSSYE